MTKFIMIFFLSFMPVVYAADNYSLDLENVSLKELIKVVYGDMKDDDFLIDDDILKNDKRFTINIKSLKKDTIKVFLDSILDREGYNLRHINSITSISKKQENKSDYKLMVYTPRYRSSNYIVDALKDFLPRDTFNSNMVQSQVSVDSTNVNSSGTSAFDIASKSQDDIIVYAAPSTIDKFLMLVDRIDKPVDELVLTTYIYEVNNGRSNENSLSITASLLGDKLGANLAGNLLENFLSIKTFGITAIISALKSDNRYKVLSSPFIRVRDRQKASFTVGSEVPILGAVVTNNGGQNTQSVEYRNAGIILNIEPRINRDQYELKINQEISNFVQTVNGVNNSPTLIKRSIDTVVNAQDDEVIILGGLDETKNTTSKTGFTFLPFMNSSYSSNEKNSIILVIHVKKSQSF